MRHIVVVQILLLLGFNPRICKRCDIFSIPVICSNRVSIHASVKDATPEQFQLRLFAFVSIHASVKDATTLDVVRLVLVDVSIHASVKDATIVVDIVVYIGVFQSTHL